MAISICEWIISRPCEHEFEVGHFQKVWDCHIIHSNNPANQSWFHFKDAIPITAHQLPIPIHVPDRYF